MFYTQLYQVNVHDTDLNRIVSAGGLMRMMQDTANLQMERQTPSYLELFDSGYSFVLSRFRLVVNRPVEWPEQLESRTWAVAAHGVSYPRDYCIRKDGEIVAQAESVWALLDRKTLRPVPNGTVNMNYGREEPLQIPGESRVRIPPQLSLQKAGEHTVTYLETDVNGHMNNTYYPDMICDCLPMRGQWVREINISYLKEAPMGAHLTLLLAEDQGRWYGRSVREDGCTNAEFTVTLCSL